MLTKSHRQAVSVLCSDEQNVWTFYRSSISVAFLRKFDKPYRYYDADLVIHHQAIGFDPPDDVIMVLADIIACARDTQDGRMPRDTHTVNGIGDGQKGVLEAERQRTPLREASNLVTIGSEHVRGEKRVRVSDEPS